MSGSDYPFMPPSSTCVTEDLLFFDTFSHSNLDKNNFDLVQFPSPVMIDFIKIVPLGQPIEANIPGSFRLGATNPSKCELEFFINDLTKQDAHTMTDMGKFYCTEKDTDFSPPLQIQTDGLLLRGNYRTLTLAIFGQVVTYDEKLEDESVMMLSATSPPAQTPASPIASEKDVAYNVDQELLRGSNEGEEYFDNSTLRSCELSRDNPLFENDADINEDNAIMDLVDGENEDEIIKESIDFEDSSNKDNDRQETFSPQRSDDMNEYSNSVDLELRQSNKSSISQTQSRKINDRRDRRSESKSRVESQETESPRYVRNQLSDPDVEEWVFDVNTYAPKPLRYFPDPSITIQEKSLETQLSSHARQPDSFDQINKEVDKVKEMFDVLGCTDEFKTEEWVTLVEDLTNDLTNMSLSRIINSEEMLKFLTEQIISGLDIRLALKQRQTGFKVRHLKAGIKLATIMFHCGDAAVSMLLESHILKLLLQLYNQDQMSLPLRLMIFRCLNAACDNVSGVEHITKHVYEWHDKELATYIIDEIHDADSNVDERTRQTNFSSTCYQYMLLILMTKPTTRVMISIGNLIKKIRLHDNLSRLHSNVCGDPSQDSSDEINHERDSQHYDKTYLENCLITLQDIVRLTESDCINISQPLRHLPASIQLHVKPCTKDTYLAIYRWFKHYQIVKCINLILIRTRCPAVVDDELTIKIRCHCLTIFQRLVDSPRGSQFLLAQDCYQSTGSLLASLSAKFEPAKLRMTGMEGLPDSSLGRAVSLSFAACRDKSLRLRYHFKVLSCIDKLFEFHQRLFNSRSSNTSRTVCDPEKILHQLYIMSDHPYGLNAIMVHFSCIGNLDCILRFLDMPDDRKHLEFVRETSIDYVLELIGIFLRLNNNVLEIAEEYLDTLVDLSKSKEKTLTTRIKSLLPWLIPFETDQPFPLITYSEETFRQLTRVIRKSIPDQTIPFAKGFNFELPPQLITAVRILRQLCIPSQVETFIESSFDIFSPQSMATAAERSSQTSLPFVDSLPRQQNCNQSWNLNAQENHEQLLGMNLYDESLVDHVTQLNTLSKLFQPYDETICGDLKYHYGIMQVFEHEDLRRLLNTLRELTGNYPRPSYQSVALSGQRGRIVISYIHSVIVLIHSITCHLIDARGKEFKDTSIISVILEIYSLLCFVPRPTTVPTLKDLLSNGDLSALQASITIRSDNFRLAQQTKKLILSILISHTQMCLSVSESEENVISKSMWTKMLNEVIDFTMSAPVFFHHGLDVLTKILPPPLPHPSILDTIDQEQLFKNFNHRKLWSAHLHPLHQKLEFLISSLSICSHNEVRQALNYLCNQLSDLSSNASCMVVRVIVDSLVACIKKLTSDSSNEANLDTTETHLLLVGCKESRYAMNMILNLLSSLVSNQRFKTALANHLQILCKKDEKLLSQLDNLIKSHEDFKQYESSETSSSENLTVTSIIESIANIIKTESDRLPPSLKPPEDLIKINLIEYARKTSDRFNLTSGIAKTFRLKVLLDMNARAHRATEVSSKRFDRSTPSYNFKELMATANQKAYAAPVRGRSRASLRPDSFRSRPQNTSRPPSIHVDDFVDIYGDSSSQPGVPGGRYWPKPPTAHYPVPPGGGGSSRAHSKSKYMKLK